MLITPSSSEADVMDYLRARCGSLLHTYGPETFGGIDGEVFLGLVPATVDMVLPKLEAKHKGLLLAKIETNRNFFFRQDIIMPRVPDVRDMMQPLRASDARDITPPPRVSDARDITPPPGFSRDPTVETQTAPAPIQTVIHTPLLPGTVLPRILVELWRADDVFVAETWLPVVQLNIQQATTHRLAMRRSIAVKGYDEGTSVVTASTQSGRKWYGCLILSLRFDRIESKLELSLSQVGDLMVEGGNFFLKVYTFSNNELFPVFESGVRHSGNNSSSNSTICFDENIVLQFQQGSDARQTEVVVATRLQEERGGRTNFVASARSRSPTPIGVSVELLKSIMKAGEDKQNMYTSLFDVLLLANRSELFRLSPRYMRVEGYLFPTHEVSAHFGSEWTLRSNKQIEALKADPEYMSNQSQLVELFILSWQESWGGHSWLLRHVLLSCVLLGNMASAKRVISFAKSLARLVDLTETGFGEALFSLENDRAAADRFWDAAPTNAVLKSMYNDTPSARTPLGNLITMVRNSQTHFAESN